MYEVHNLINVNSYLLNVGAVDAGDEAEDEVRDGRGADVTEEINHEILLFEELEYLGK